MTRIDVTHPSGAVEALTWDGDGIVSELGRPISHDEFVREYLAMPGVRVQTR